MSPQAFLGLKQGKKAGITYILLLLTLLKFNLFHLLNMSFQKKDVFIQWMIINLKKIGQAGLGSESLKNLSKKVI